MIAVAETALLKLEPMQQVQDWGHSPAFASASGFPPAHSLTSRNVSDPVSATRPVSCMRASMIPVSPASLPSEYCWYSPCRSYMRYTPSSLSTTSRSSPVQPKRMIFACSHCVYASVTVHQRSHRGSIHTEQQEAFAGGGIHLYLRLRKCGRRMAERNQLRRIAHKSYSAVDM